MQFVDLLAAHSARAWVIKERLAAIEAERAALDERAEVEETRWEKQRKKLDIDLSRARE